MKGRDRLKMTYWYLMNTTSNTIPKPLLEEGIKKASSFFDEATIQTNILKRTYINIRMVYKAYIEIQSRHIKHPLLAVEIFV